MLRRQSAFSCANLAACRLPPATLPTNGTRLFSPMVIILIVGFGSFAWLAIYLALRTARGILARPRSTTFDVIMLFILYTAAQGAVAASLTRLFPGGF